MKKILVADAIHDSGRAILTAMDGIEVVVQTDLDEDQLVDVIGTYDALIVRSKTKATARVLEAGTNLKAIGRAGIGIDNIDVAEATKRGIVVFNTPDANATTTAELAISHLFSLSRYLPLADRSIRDGKWERSKFMGVEVTGKTVGIIGFGTIGRIVAERCAGLKMRVLAYDPFITAQIVSEHCAESVSLETLLEQSDYVTLHCPMIDATRGIINSDNLEKMKQGARLINCARGGLVVEKDLIEALNSGHLAGAALDVFANEPPTGSPLLSMDNVVMTPHLGASTLEAQRVVAEQIAHAVGDFLLTGKADAAVNLPRIPAEQLGRTEPYRKLAQSLGRLISALTDGPILELVIRRYGRAADVDGRPITTDALIGLLSQRLDERVNRVNAAHLAQSQGILVREAHSQDAKDFVSLIEICATADGVSTTVAGTLLGGREPRLVRIDDYHLEAVPEGHMLFTRHADEPGVIGALGSILGDAKINISRMQVGVAGGSDTAIALVAISGPLPASTLNQLRDLAAIQHAVEIEL